MGNPQKESLGEYGSGWGWDSTYAHVFDQGKKYIYKDKFDREHIDYYPMRYKNNINTSTPNTSGTWVNYGSSASSIIDTNNCKIEITNGDILHSASIMSHQVSCEAHAYNGGNYYGTYIRFQNIGQSICPKRWKVPLYSNMLTVYGIDYNSPNKSQPYDASLINMPLSFLRNGSFDINYTGTGITGTSFWWQTSHPARFGSNIIDLEFNNGINNSSGYSLRCVAELSIRLNNPPSRFSPR